MSTDQITAYKGFNDDWTCRGHQYEVGLTYETDGPVEQCRSGFHACETAIDVLGYYGPAESRFAEVLLEGKFDRDDSSDSKIAAAKITVVAELSLPDFIDRAVKQIVAMAKGTKKESGYQSAATNTGDQSAATNTGDQSAATNTGDRSAATNTGYQSAATNTGDRSAATNTGYRSAATNTGYRSAATNTGYRSAATNTGDRSAATNTGDRSAATNTGYRSAATNTGYRSAATNTGYRSAATNTGDRSAASVGGKASTAVSTDEDGKVMAEREGCSLFANEMVWSGSEYEIKSNACGITGRDGIEPGVWYRAKGGRLVEADQ